MLRDAGVGHVSSEINQFVALMPRCQARAVSNVFVGVGACRFTGGVELACHDIEGYNAEFLDELLIFDNKRRAVEMGAFVADSKSPARLYGCSVGECIQCLHLFKEQLSEGERYSYVCGRVDSHAALTCGSDQPETMCVFSTCDACGFDSFGESLRLLLLAFGGRSAVRDGMASELDCGL
mmetsp:Transcript_131800/g.409735  ORF Transcript_131800/g.409735 Transcript_131800/m.409735 type:complete len:180 (+) Transcript_131800:275-814(+)